LVIALTATFQQDQQLSRRLQYDSIQLSGKTIYINPFLYWRRFDSNTDRWLREPGQLGEDQIRINRNRFYPEIEWHALDSQEAALKDASVEMFLKSLELIGTFHPELSSSQLLEVERKMAVTKKRAFERWVEKSFRRKYRQETKERKSIERERFWRAWKEWLGNETTQQAFVPFVTITILSACVGWSIGISTISNAPSTSLEQNEQSRFR
tara:strand:- start:1266 stop:1895 length:630 start_codon:yes stop_codon:yes gene_type:complete